MAVLDEGQAGVGGDDAPVVAQSQSRKGVGGRRRKGTVEWHEDHWDARPTLADGTKGPRMCQPKGMSKGRAQNVAELLTEKAKKEGLVREPAHAAPTTTASAGGGGGAAAVPPSSDDGPTLEAWAGTWCDDREARGYTSVEDDRGRLRKWVFPRLSPPLGGRRMKTAIQSADLEALVEDLDNRVLAKELSWKTAINVWGLVSKMFKDACRSKRLALRVRADNPAIGVEGPDEGAKKIKNFLYPSEFLTLEGCERVPLRWRRIFAVVTYLYIRAAEARGLEWPDIDLEHLSVMLHRAVDDDGTITYLKGAEARRLAIEPPLVPLLVAMKAEAEERAERRVFPKFPPEEDLADKFRHWLRRAGVTREELFVNDATRKWITFHDTRATGLTWRAVRGDDPIKIMRAAGHKNMQTTLGYIRTAEAVAIGFGAVFPDLPPCLSSARVSPKEEGDGSEVPGIEDENGRSQRELNPRYRRERPAS